MSTIIKVFISHSSKDVALAAALTELLRIALPIPPKEIRCTSVPGYKLPVGAKTDDDLACEAQEAETFVGIITGASIESTYVVFELGARWGSGKHLAPLVRCEADKAFLRPPLKGYNALRCDDASDMNQFVEDIGMVLGTPPHAASTYQGYIQKVVVEASKQPVTAGTTQDETPVKGLGVDFPEGLSEQAIDILAQLVRSDAQRVLLMRSGSMRSANEVIVKGARGLKVSEPKFLEQDFESLYHAGLLTQELSQNGHPVYCVTRKGTAFANSKDPVTQQDKSSSPIIDLHLPKTAVATAEQQLSSKTINVPTEPTEDESAILRLFTRFDDGDGLLPDFIDCETLMSKVRCGASLERLCAMGYIVQTSSDPIRYGLTYKGRWFALKNHLCD
jgi:hypothetical protein